ncbi:MAG: fibronectin type III domain-containing protein [Chitinispirillaceae bacterium]|nr:fibronectin type III domain-containing protein [Chitinispirillaceae bacterium]
MKKIWILLFFFFIPFYIFSDVRFFYVEKYGLWDELTFWTLIDVSGYSGIYNPPESSDYYYRSTDGKLDFEVMQAQSVIAVGKAYRTVGNIGPFPFEIGYSAISAHFTRNDVAPVNLQIPVFVDLWSEDRGLFVDPNRHSIDQFPYTFILDQDPPYYESEVNVISAAIALNGWYNDDVILEAVPSDGQGSGIWRNQYRIRQGAITGTWRNTEAVTNNMLLTGEGDFFVDFRAIDNVGNISSIITKEIKIDRTAPVAPASINSTFITTVKDDGNRKITGLHLSWDEVTEDLPSPPVPNSGVAGYEISWMLARYFDLELLPDGLSVTGSDSTSFDLDLISDGFIPGESYKFAVRTVDNAGNYSDDESAWAISEEVFIPEVPIQIESINYQIPEINPASGEPEYHGTIVFDRGLDYFSPNNLLTIKGIRLVSDFGIDLDQNLNQIIDANGSLIAPWSISAGKLTYTFTITGKMHAHQRYEYSVFTYYYLDQVVELGNKITANRLPNIPPAFHVKIETSEQDLLGEINEQGYIPGTSTPLRLYTGVQDDLQVSLLTVNTDGTDSEGDTLKFTLYKFDSTGTTNLGEACTKDIPQLINHVIALRATQSSIFHLFVEVEEYAEDETGVVKSLGAFYTDVNDIPYQSIKTLHEDPQEGFFVYFDFNEGTGAFEVRKRNGTDPLDGENPTNTEEVDLFIPANAITDRTGPVESGIADVYVWNAPLSSSTTTSVDILNEIMAHEPPDAEKFNCEIQTDAVEPGDPPQNAPDTNHTITWQLLPLSSGEEGYRLVAMKVVDNVGKSRYFWKTVMLDKMPPTAPALTGFHHTYSGNMLHVTWVPGAGCSSYKVQYPDAMGVMQSDGSPTPELSINTATYSANAPIAISVIARDKAGNTAEPMVYTPFTSATLGTLSLLADEYSPTLGHYFEWRVTGGVATRFELQQLDSEGSVITQIPFVDDLCRQSGLMPAHATFRYRLVAFNGSDDATFGAIFDRTLKNNAPSAPNGLTPTGFVPGEVKLSWQAASDVDGDILTYRVYLKQAGGEFTLLGTVKDCVFPEESATLALEDGEEYTFYVEADDTPASGLFTGLLTQSTEEKFTVDASAPVISFVNISDLPAEELIVEIRENGSGIAMVGYWTSNGTGSRESPINLTLAEASVGVYTATIPLLEGEYSITVAAEDQVHNRSERSTGSLNSDHTSPVISDVTIQLPDLPGGNFASTGNVPITLMCHDDFSGIKELSYGYAETATGPVQSWMTILLEPVQGTSGASNEKRYVKSLNFTGENGTTSYLVIKVIDWAGNESIEWRSGTGILVDRTPPEVSLSVSGYSTLFSQYYISTISQLNVSGTYAENDSAIIQVQFALAVEGTDENLLNWQSELALALNAVLVDGNAYYIHYRVINAVGLASTTKSKSFVYDSSGAFNLAITGLPSGYVVSGEEIRFTAMAEEPDSALAEFRVSVGNSTDDTVLSRLINGNEQGQLVVRNSDKAEFAFIVPQVPNGDYQVSFEVTNAAGIVTTAQNVGTIRVDNSQEKLIVTTAGKYSSQPDTLAAHWNYTGTKTVVGYEYRIVKEDGSTLTAWQGTSQTSCNASGLALENGALYFFEARALFDTGNSLTGKSLSVLVDFTPPQFDPTTGLETPSFAQSTGLWLKYLVTDSESGVESVQVLLEKASGENERTDIGHGWINIPNKNNEVIPLLVDNQGNPLMLSTGDSIYVTVRAQNGGGISCDRYAPVIVIDDTPPPSPRVIDQGDALNTSQYPSASWLWSEPDPESGPVVYEWTIVRSLTDTENADWYLGDSSCTAAVEETLGTAFPREHLAVWYFVVRATNRSGLTTLGTSNGFIYDETAPLLAHVKLLQGNDEIVYTQNFTGLSVGIDAVEEATAITQYTAIAGYWDANNEWIDGVDDTVYTSNSGLLSIDQPPPTASPGDIIVFRGTCINEAGLPSQNGYTKGVLVYSTLPSITAIRARVAATMIYADWDVSSTGLPVTGYGLELRNAATGQTVYTSTLSTKNIVIDTDKENLASGRYGVYVKAVNATGSDSPWKTGPVIVVDNTPPVVANFETPRYASSFISISCVAQDDESGIGEYQYQIGTWENPGAGTGGWKSIFTTSTALTMTVNFADLAAGLSGVLDGSSIYVRLRVKNGVGLWSGERTSNPIVIDKSPPTTPIVSVSNTFSKYAYKIEGVSVTSSDLESGIPIWAYTVTQSLDPVLLAQANWIQVHEGEDTTEIYYSDLIAEGFIFEHGDRVYICVKTKNGAGDWSGTGNSQVVTFDLAAPVVTFTRGEEVIIVNDQAEMIEFVIAEEFGSEVTLQLTLEYPDGSAETYPVEMTGIGSHEFVFDKTTAGPYELHARATDAAGNVSLESTQRIRVNAAPEVTIEQNFETTPGKPLTLSATVIDLDGNGSFACRWIFGDGHEVENESTIVIHPYLHREMYDQHNEYLLTLEVTDNDGRMARVYSNIILENTRRGRLYVDEYWDGEHTILGDILVPSGITLTVMVNTRVLAVSDPLEGYDHRLTIEGKLITEAGANFTTADGTSELWNGILVSGEAILNGITIERAKRGLTVLVGAVVDLNNTLFGSNEIGLHVFDDLTVNACIFRDNELYGVKEDGTLSPVLTDCVFSGNQYDYYDTELTVMSVEDLDELEGNSGNRRE